MWGSLLRLVSFAALKKRIYKICDKFVISLLFFLWLVVICLFDPLIQFISRLDLPYQYQLPIFIWASGDNARYILSALSQAQAAIFGIFFTLIFILTQIQIQNKAASPLDMKRQLKSKNIYIIILLFVISITVDLVLLRYARFNDEVDINIMGVLVLSVVCILLLLSYMRTMILNLFDTLIKEEILRGEARYNLVGADLAHAKLTGVVLPRRDLRFANLEGADLLSAGLGATDLRGANLRGANLTNAHLHHADLTGADLTGADLTNADLIEANLTNAHLDGAILREAKLTSGHQRSTIDLDAIPKGANLTNAHLEHADLTGADLMGADLTNADLTNANLTNADLRGANLMNTNLNSANLSGAKLERNE